MLPILLPAPERNDHLKLEEEIRHKILSMSTATIDRLLQMPRRTMRTKKKPRVVPEPRRRIKMRTFADWNEPLPGSMEMDLVAHCGEANRGSYVHSMVLTDIASGWTEAAPIVVREGTLVVETPERIRMGLPFALRALDVDNGSEFVSNRLIEYCLGHGIELTRSRPYRKNDQAWIEQKNGAVVRKLLGYRRFEGLAAARAITRLYGASRLFVNFFQPSFKLAAKQRDGAKVAKRYHPPRTPCERLLPEGIPMAAKSKLRQIAADLDPLKLLEEMRAVQAYLAALADGETPPPATSEPPNLAAFVEAYRAPGPRAKSVRPSPSKPNRVTCEVYKSLNTNPYCGSTAALKPVIPPTPAATAAKMQEKPKPVDAKPGQARVQALGMVWPIVCRRLEEFPNINAPQLFEELYVQFPGRFTRKEYKTLVRRVNLWRRAARARGRRPEIFKDHWEEMARCLEERPDQTALELLVEFQVRYPGRYSLRQLHTLQKRVRAWRQQAVQRLIGEVSSLAPYLASDSTRLASE
ncbi:transposase [Mesorhizobium sp. M1300]|uniref:integrase catalytic domain-containing protein n=1 Tax=Mesorhizobium sp. M1300 TaxID=2957077 RepID=UPI00333B7C13